MERSQGSSERLSYKVQRLPRSALGHRRLPPSGPGPPPQPPSQTLVSQNHSCLYSPPQLGSQRELFNESVLHRLLKCPQGSQEKRALCDPAPQGLPTGPSPLCHSPEPPWPLCCSLKMPIHPHLGASSWPFPLLEDCTPSPSKKRAAGTELEAAVTKPRYHHSPQKNLPFWSLRLLPGHWAHEGCA